MNLLQLSTAFILVYNCNSATISDSNDRSKVDYKRANTLSGFGDGNNMMTATYIPDVPKDDVIPTIYAHEELQIPQFEDMDVMPSVKEKRCKTSTYDNFLGSSHNPGAALTLSRRDIQSDLLKKRCENCKESTRCKKLGKCDLCLKICENFEASLNPKKGPKILDIQERNINDQPEDFVGIANRIGENFSETVSGLSEKEDRYYTVGSFESGPVYDLLTRLLHISNKVNVDRLIVLAKAETPGVIDNTPNPVVIDTAHVFTINEGQPKKVNIEVHKVMSGEDVEALTSKLNKDLDVAIEHKKKLIGDSHLTTHEIDEIIEHAISRMNGNLLPKPKSLVGEAPHLETINTGDQNNTDDIVGIPLQTDKDETNHPTSTEFVACSKEESDEYRTAIEENELKANGPTVESKITEKSINHKESLDSDKTTEIQRQTVPAKLSHNRKNAFTELPSLLNRLAEQNANSALHKYGRDKQDVYGQPAILNRYQQPVHRLNSNLAPNYPNQKIPMQVYKQPIPQISQTYPEGLNYPTQNPSMIPVHQYIDGPVRYFDDPNRNMELPQSGKEYGYSQMIPVENPNQYYPGPTYPANYPTLPYQKLTDPLSIPSSYEKGLDYRPKEIIQPVETNKQNYDVLHEDVQKDDSNESGITFKQDTPNIFVPDLPISDNFYVGGKRLGDGKVPVKNNPENTTLGTTLLSTIDTGDPTLKNSWYEAQYHKLRQWVEENVGMTPNMEQTKNKESSTANNVVVHNVNDIINSVTATAKDLNKQISDLVKTSNGSIQSNTLNSASDNSEDFNIKLPSKNYLVKLGNGNEFRTRLSSDEERQITDKLNEDIKLTQNENPYDKHPRLKSVYQNGKWEYVKLPPKNILGSASPFTDGRATEEISNTGASKKLHQIPFIDPKLLNTESIIQHARKVPDYFIKKPNDVVSIINLDNGDKNFTDSPLQTVPKLQNDGKDVLNYNKDGVSQQNPEIHSRIDDETVGCSDEESDEYLRNSNSENSITEKNKQSDTLSEQKPHQFIQENNSEMKTNVIEEIAIADKDIEGNTTNHSSQHSIADNILGSDNQFQNVIKETPNDKNESSIETTTLVDDTIGCKKEDKDKYEMIHFQPMHNNDEYRSSVKNSEHKIHLPTIQELLHPKPVDEILNPKPKSSIDHDNHRKQSHSHGKSHNLENKDEPNDTSDENTSEDLKTYSSKDYTVPSSRFKNSQETNQFQKFLPIPNTPQINSYENSRVQPYNINQQRFSNLPFQETFVNPNSFRSNQNLMPMPMPSNFPPQFQSWHDGQGNADELIGSPIMTGNIENRLQEPTQHQNFRHLGKFVANYDQPLSLHSRDVSEQTKLRNMYFVGDGIKLPLNMKEHDDGSLHLSVDVKSLCNCKHCNGKHVHNGTIILQQAEAQNEENYNDTVPLLNHEKNKDRIPIESKSTEETNMNREWKRSIKRSYDDYKIKNDLRKLKETVDKEKSNEINHVVSRVNEN